MSNINDNLLDTINSQILHGNRTLNLISQSYNLLNSQQQNIYLLTRLLQSNINNNNANTNRINRNSPIQNPFSIVINDISVSEISGSDISGSDISGSDILPSNVELNAVLYSTLMNLLSDSSLNVLDNNTEPTTTLDISSVTILKKFRELENPPTNTCSITLEQFDDDDNILQIRNCSHYFKCNALVTWLSSNTVCPICRQNVE